MPLLRWLLLLQALPAQMSRIAVLAAVYDYWKSKVVFLFPLVVHCSCSIQQRPGLICVDNMHLLLRKVWTPASMLSWLPFSNIPLPMMSSVYIWGNTVLLFKLSIWQCKTCVIPHFHVWANLPVTSDQRMHVDYTLNTDVTLQGIYQCFSAIMVSNLPMNFFASGNVRIWNWSVGVVCCLFVAQRDHWQKPFLHHLQVTTLFLMLPDFFLWNHSDNVSGYIFYY
jgi:hypothetical protein